MAWKKNKGTQEIHFAFGQIPFAKRIAIMGKEQTMSDLIRRTDAIKAIEDLPNAYNGWSDAYDKAYIIGTLEEVPTVEPKQGKWIDAEIRHEDGVLPIQVCSECKTFYPLEYTGGGHRFCPNCGCRMKGADDE